MESPMAMGNINGTKEAITKEISDKVSVKE